MTWNRTSSRWLSGFNNKDMCLLREEKERKASFVYTDLYNCDKNAFKIRIALYFSHCDQAKRKIEIGLSYSSCLCFAQCFVMCWGINAGKAFLTFEKIEEWDKTSKTINESSQINKTTQHRRCLCKFSLEHQRSTCGKFNSPHFGNLIYNLKHFFAQCKSRAEKFSSN